MEEERNGESAAAQSETQPSALGRAGLERSDFAVRRVPLIFAWK